MTCNLILRTHARRNNYLSKLPIQVTLKDCARTREKFHYLKLIKIRIIFSIQFSFSKIDVSNFSTSSAFILLLLNFTS